MLDKGSGAGRFSRPSTENACGMHEGLAEDVVGNIVRSMTHDTLP